MTQRERIYQMLKEAGPNGIRSDAFIKSYMPRAAARIQELKDSGVEITSEREGKFCRYVLRGDVGVGVGIEDKLGQHLESPPARRGEKRALGSASADSGKRPSEVSHSSPPCASEGPARLFSSPPSAYDPFSEAA